MKKKIAVTAAFCLGAFGVAAVSTHANAQTLPPISVVGNHLEAGGQNIQLRGVDETGTEYECITDKTSAFDEPQDSASTFANMQAWGINAVRVPLNEDCWLGINGVKYSGAEYQTAIEKYVSDLEANGFYPIINLHFSAPGTTKATGQEPMADESHSPAFWTSVATAFASDDHVIFDLYNEPYPDNNTDNATAWSCVLNGGTCKGVSFTTAGMQQLLTDVRDAGATTQPIMVGGPEYAGVLDDWEQYMPVDPDHQLVASIHIYSNPLGSPCNTESCWNSQIAGVDSMYPVVIGEFGDTEKACESTFSTSLMDWADTQSESVSYLAWAWTAEGGCAAEPALLSNFANATPTGYGSGVEAHYQSFLNGPIKPAVVTKKHHV